MSSDRAPPEREAAEPSGDDAIDAEREAAHEPLASISTEPGDRRTDSVELLRIEAELVCEQGKEPDNPAKPRTEAVGERFLESIDDSDLVPAWTRPWEGGDE